VRIKIIINNNQSRLICDRKRIIKLREALKIRAKNYFWSPAYRRRQWDGYVRYISEVNGLFATGLLDQVIALMDSFKYRWKIIDQRDLVLPNKDITSLGKITFRPDQLEAISLFKNNKLAGIPFLRGIMAEATNAGKSIIAAGIIGSFSNKKTSILLTNSKDLYNQLLKDFKKIFGKAVGQVNSTTFDWQRINICMVQTLSLRIKKFPQYRNGYSIGG
jgi:hypothetical protein